MTHSLNDEQEVIAPEAEEPVLTPKLSPRWALTLPHLLLVTFCALLVVIKNYTPLYTSLESSNLWGNIVYGRWILENRSLPTDALRMPLAEGITVIDSTWLSQVFFALVERAGLHWLSNVSALVGLATFLLLARVYYLQSGRLAAATVTLLVVISLQWFHILSALCVEHLAGVCFACLLWLIVSSNVPPATLAAAASERGQRVRRLWVGVPILFVLWANLHSSFLWGLAVLACYFVGQLIDVGWQTRSLRAVLKDRSVRRWLYLCELGLVATLLNPYGFDLLLYLLWFADPRNLSAVPHWQPVTLLTAGGPEMLFSFALLLFVVSSSRRRMPVAHWLLLALFGIGALFQRRLLSWYTPVLGLVITPHIAEIWDRLRVARPEEVTDCDAEPTKLPAGRAWAYSLLCVLVVWGTLAITFPGRLLLRNPPRLPSQVIGRTSPSGLTRYLRESPPDGQIFNPHWLGEWLAYDGPAGLRLFTPMASQAQLVPRQVWRDYERISSSGANWDRTLEKYVINTLVIDSQRQASLARVIRRTEEWNLLYEDESAIVFQRRPPNPSSAVNPGAKSSSSVER